MAKYLMAIDAGTGSVRAVLFDLEGNQLGMLPGGMGAPLRIQISRQHGL